MPADLLIEHAPLELRERARRAAQWFTASETWLPLAESLSDIRHTRAFRAWGFSSFSAYVEHELDLPRSVASELVSAYRYLDHRHPECVKDRSAAEQLTIPSYANLAILARSSTRLPEEITVALDQGLFDGTIRRNALKDAIKKELARPEAAADITADVQTADDATPSVHPSFRDLQEAMMALFSTLDLWALREQLTLVFEGWDEIDISDRRQLYARLQMLLEKLEMLRQSIQLPTGEERAGAPWHGPEFPLP